MRGNCRAYGLILVGFVVPACSGFEHDCVETRDCSGPKGFIEAGGTGDWWEPSESGAGGDGGASFPLPEAGSPTDSAGAAGSTGGTLSDQPPPDAEPPAVLAVTPADGATGQRSDQPIVIQFSEPMNSEATEGAYQSDDLPAASVSFTWDDSDTVLTITPRAGLAYAAGALASPANTYHFGLDGSARNRAGQPLAAVRFSFSTLRQVSSELRADPARTGTWTDGEGEGVHNCVRAAKAPYQPTVCIGDDANNVRYAGFLSFDLSVLPDNISSVVSARLQANAVTYGAPEALGASRLEHVSFQQLGDTALRVEPLAPLGPFYSGPSLLNVTQLVLSEDLAEAVQDDYANRAARQSRSQYRLGFSTISPDGSWDDLELPTNGIRLGLTYLLP